MKEIFRKPGGLFVAISCLLLLGVCLTFGSILTAKAAEMKLCPNCGMMLKKWARTNHQFINSEGNFRTCSIHCVADMSKKSGEEPQKVLVADFLNPHEMLPVERAVYVIGSSAPGTMTLVSKLAFRSQGEAKKFASKKGGKIAAFPNAFAAATKELPKSKAKIEKKRIQMGKIVVPTAKDRCAVCNMKPERYPRNSAQLITPEKRRFHFCSTKCLFSFLDSPREYGAHVVKVTAVWVHDYASGRYIYGPNGYYVVGAKVFGPMGPEAIPFDLKAQAKTFAQENGGTVLRFNEVKSTNIGAK